MIQRKTLRDQAAQGMPHQMAARDAKRIQQAGNVVGEVAELNTPMRLVGFPMPAQVKADRAQAAIEGRDNAIPCVQPASHTMNQDQIGSFALYAASQFDAVNVKLSVPGRCLIVSPSNLALWPLRSNRFGFSITTQH